MKALLLFILFQTGVQYYHLNKGILGTGSISVNDSYRSRTNIDSLTNIYDTVSVSTRYGLKIYVR